MNPERPTPQQVRDFLLNLYADKLQEKALKEIPDDFDLLPNGIIDSMGILEMVSELEKEFKLELDMSGIETEHLTMVGPLARYVAAQAAQSDSKAGL